MPRRKYDLGRDGLWRLVLSLAVPTALAQAVNVLYAIVDRMFIGHIAGYGDIALAGVGVAAPIATFISSFATLIGMGGAPIMAMCEGHGDHETAERTVTTGFYLLLISSAILTPVFLIFRDPILMAFTHLSGRSYESDTVLSLKYDTSSSITQSVTISLV